MYMKMPLESAVICWLTQLRCGPAGTVYQSTFGAFSALTLVSSAGDGVSIPASEQASVWQVPTFITLPFTV
jgi:hypothetical protein